MATHPLTATVLSIKEKHGSSIFFKQMHGKKLRHRSVLQETLLLVPHTVTFPDLPTDCNRQLQRIRRSVRYTV